MAIVPSVQVQDSVIDDFRGPWLRPQNTDVPASEALLSLNAEYGPHLVSTRAGFAQYWADDESLTCIYNWVGAGFNYLIVYDLNSGAMQMVNLLTPLTTLDLFSAPSTDGFRIARAGSNAYCATFLPYGTGIPYPKGNSQCQVLGAGVYLCPAFMNGLTTKPSLSATGSGGSITPGVHSVGYILTSISGFMTPPCPINSVTGIFDTSSQVNVAAGQHIVMTLTFTAPVGCTTIQPVMSPVSNPYQYFIVPGYSASVTPGSNTVTFTIGGASDPAINDNILIATAQDVTSRQYLLTQTTMGTGPFFPFCVLEYGNRIVYLTLDAAGNPAAYISNPSDPEYITELYNKIRLPGVLQITSGFVLRGILYLMGPSWTYAYQDNGGQPATWSAPTLVDGDIGTYSCFGAIVNASNDWAAIASRTGLYIFNGQYQERPLTYMVDQDWRRINWGAAQTLRMIDNKDKKQILVMVPLDGATSPNYLMCFDYTDGLDYQTVKYSLWSISGYTMRGMALVQNPTSGREESWLTSSTLSQSVIRQMNDTDDPSPYQDFVLEQQTIPFTWECAPQPEGSIGQIMSHIGGYVRAVGNGLLRATAYSLDRKQAVNWANPITLAAQPGVEYWRQFYINAERASVRFTCGQSPGDYCILSGYRHRYYPWALRR